MDEILGDYRQRTADAVTDAIDDLDFFMNDDILATMRDRAREMARSGKMVRGSLVLLAHDMYDGDHPDAAEQAASAIEITHTALLAHDDIIDRDERRRGLPALHRQYSDISSDHGLDEPDHTGTGMAVCAGDIGFFLAFRLLSSIDVPAARRESVTRLFADEFVRVGVAESEDIIMGAAATEPSEDEILDLYRNKTARYTFSLPLMAGATLAGASDDDLQALGSCGELLGIIYQLKDDELDLFGSEEATGKDRGSDLQENKKTLHRMEALRRMDDEERERTKEQLRDGIDPATMEDLIDRFDDLNVRETIQERMEDLHRRAREEIGSLDISESDKKRLLAIGRFCRERDR